MRVSEIQGERGRASPSLPHQGDLAAVQQMVEIGEKAGRRHILPDVAIEQIALRAVSNEDRVSSGDWPRTFVI